MRLLQKWIFVSGFVNSVLSQMSGILSFAGYIPESKCHAVCKKGVADPRYDFICEILSYGISRRSVHPLNQQRRKKQ